MSQTELYMLNPRKPDFFIVGAPKCGTTAMATYLGSHPEIFITTEEFHYFGSDLRFTRSLSRNPDWSQMSEEQYLSYFAKATSEKRLGEGSVFYLYSKRAAKEIHEFNSAAQIIVMLRQPVEAMYSLHSQMLYGNEENIEDFREALAAEPDREQGLRIPYAICSLDGLLYRKIFQYPSQVERYFDVFGRKNVMVLIFDDLKNDVAGTYRRILEFLSVDSEFIPEFPVININKRVRSRWLHTFMANPPDPIRPVARFLACKKWTRDLVRWFISVFNTRYEKRTPMDPLLQRELNEEFKPQIDSLSSLLDRDLSFWYSESLPP
jgi:hypothetical protein